MMKMTRRRLLATAAGMAASSLLPLPLPVLAAGRRTGSVLIVGAGPAGSAAAQTLARYAQDLRVTWVGKPDFRPLVKESVGLSAPLPSSAKVDGMAVVYDTIAGIDPVAGVAWGADGSRYTFDRVVLAPGIRARHGVVDGYDDAVARAMPHGWDGGDGTFELGRRIAAMADGGTVVLALPAGPMRFSGAAVRRAGEVAAYLRRAKPRAKLLVLGGADRALDGLLETDGIPAGMVEWVSAAQGGTVSGVEIPGRVLVGPAGRFSGDVVSFVPPQEAGGLAHACGVVGADGWCPVDPVSMRATHAANVFVAGDAARLPGEVKSGVAAALQGQCAALAVLSDLDLGRRARA